MTLESILTRTRTPYRLIVVDNGSSEDMQEMLMEYYKKGVIKVLVLLDRNYGLEHAKNTGLRFVHSEPYFVNTDNDLIIEGPSKGTDWLAKLIEIMDDNPDFGAVAARPQALFGVHNIFKDEVKPDGEIVKHLTDDGQVGFFYGGDGPCGGSYRIMRTEAVKKEGWRDIDHSSYKDDADPTLSRSEEHCICGSLKNQGLKSGYAKHVRCYHLFGDGNWGYEDGVPHYHVARDFGEPKDVEFDPYTCIPKKEQY